MLVGVTYDTAVVVIIAVTAGPSVCVYVLVGNETLWTTIFRADAVVRA